MPVSLKPLTMAMTKPEMMIAIGSQMRTSSHAASRQARRRLKRSTSSAGATAARRGAQRPQRCRELARTSSALSPLRRAVGERHSAVALGQARAVGAEQERDVGVARARRGRAAAEARAGAAWSRAGRRRERPRRCPGRRRRRRRRGCRRRRRRCGARRNRRRRPRTPREPVLEATAPRRRDPQRGRRARSPRARRAAPRSGAAGAGVGALGQAAVRRRRRLADLRARAPALVDRPCSRSAPSAVLVEADALGLAHDRAVPVEAERREVGSCSS